MRNILLGVSLSLVAAVGGGCAAGRNIGDGCTESADCKPELYCEANTCQTPPTCGDGRCNGDETPDTCCVDCVCTQGSCNSTTKKCVVTSQCAAVTKSCATTACCAGLTCSAAKICTKPTVRPVCGNGKCETGESQTTCCNDCGCPAGSTCRAGSCGTTGTALTWNLKNTCADAASVEFRFFSQNRTWQWPGGGLVYVSDYGTSVAQALSCNAGERICIGADQPDSGWSWGVGIDGTESCTDCCATCTNGTVTYSFDCP